MNTGNHFGGYKYRNRRDKGSATRNSILGTIFSLVAGTVVKDLTNDDSKIKKIISNFIHPKQIEDKDKNNKIIDAEYKIIDENNEEKTDG